MTIFLKAIFIGWILSRTKLCTKKSYIKMGPSVKSKPETGKNCKNPENNVISSIQNKIAKKYSVIRRQK